MNAAQKKRIHILYLTAEQWPTFRSDLIVLFGKYLPRYGVTCDLVTERDVDAESTTDTKWGAGTTVLCRVPKNRAMQYLIKFWHCIYALISMDASRYDVVQVRDMPVIALFALIAARIKGLPFIYWMSFPQSEGQVFRAKARGPKAGIRYWFPLIQGTLGKWVLYKLVLPRSDHVFLQSAQMVEDVATYGIAKSKLTPVPMGVDLEASLADAISPVQDSRLDGKRPVVYLGTLDRSRGIELLFEMMTIVRKSCPDIVLILVGDTEDAAHRDWLKSEARRLGVDDLVIWTGWVSTKDAWSYVKSAQIGLSPFPRGYLLDSASPTKAVEYMAIGLPVIVNDNPDQEVVVTESKGGVCVKLDASAFASALVTMMEDPEQLKRMGEMGREYISRTRGYDRLAMMVMQSYIDFFNSSTNTSGQ